MESLPQTEPGDRQSQPQTQSRPDAMEQPVAPGPNPTTQDAAFLAFDAYPWSQDPRFAALLRRIFSSGATPATEARLRLARHSFFTRMLGGPTLDLESYAAWLRAHEDHVSPDAQLLAALQSAPVTDGAGSAVTAASPPEPPSPLFPWQAAAPKEPLYVDRSARDSSDSSEPSYPSRFAEMIRCIQQGLPVPGIRNIPTTVTRDPSIKPFGSRPAPRKPWEKGPAFESAVSPSAQPSVDQEFPPLESEPAGLIAPSTKIPIESAVAEGEQQSSQGPTTESENDLQKNMPPVQDLTIA